MKSTDSVLFLLHQKRCVKCRTLLRMRRGAVMDPEYFKLLKLHERNMKVLYHLIRPEDPLEVR